MTEISGDCRAIVPLVEFAPAVRQALLWGLAGAGFGLWITLASLVGRVLGARTP